MSDDNSSERISVPFVLTIVKNTKDTLIVTSSVLSGKVKQVIVDIPSGWAYSAGFRIEFGNRKVMPTRSLNAELYFTGDDTDFTLRPNIDINEEPIKIFGINNDAVNDHPFSVIFEIELPRRA